MKVQFSVIPYFSQSIPNLFFTFKLSEANGLNPVLEATWDFFWCGDIDVIQVRKNRQLRAELLILQEAILQFRERLLANGTNPDELKTRFIATLQDNSIVTVSAQPGVFSYFSRRPSQEIYLSTNPLQLMHFIENNLCDVPHHMPCAFRA